MLPFLAAASPDLVSCRRSIENKLGEVSGIGESALYTQSIELLHPPIWTALDWPALDLPAPNLDAIKL